MRIQLIAVGKRQPVWINDGYEEYARRLKGPCKLDLTEIPLGHRSRATSPDKARDSEGRRMLRVIPTAAHVVALAVDGQAWSTIELAERLSSWTVLGTSVCLLVGDAVTLLRARRAAQGVQAERDEGGCVGAAENAEHATFVVKVIVGLMVDWFDRGHASVLSAVPEPPGRNSSISSGSMLTRL